MGDYSNNHYKFRIFRNYRQAIRHRRHTKMVSTLATGLVGALIGGFLSVGLNISTYTNKLQTNPVVPGQQSTMSTNCDYSDTSCYPVVEIAKKVGPAVVTISNFLSVNNHRSIMGSNDLSNELSGKLIEMNSGSGFIIDAHNGYIVTNYHVIKGAQKLSVGLANGKNINAQVVGADSSTDLAVIKISDTNNLTEVILGDSSKLQVGEPVVAIGNPGGKAFAGSVTAGVVSATNRIINAESTINLIQTDAAINPGNSGGPLVNYLGQVIGINTAKQTGNEGMGFAIPITEALPIFQQLIQNCCASQVPD